MSTSLTIDAHVFVPRELGSDRKTLRKVLIQDCETGNQRVFFKVGDLSSNVLDTQISDGDEWILRVIRYNGDTHIVSSDNVRLLYEICKDLHDGRYLSYKDLVESQPDFFEPAEDPDDKLFDGIRNKAVGVWLSMDIDNLDDGYWVTAETY